MVPSLIIVLQSIIHGVMFLIITVFCLLTHLSNPGLHEYTFYKVEIVKHTLQSVSTHKMAIEIFSTLFSYSLLFSF